MTYLDNLYKSLHSIISDNDIENYKITDKDFIEFCHSNHLKIDHFYSVKFNIPFWIYMDKNNGIYIRLFSLSKDSIQVSYLDSISKYFHKIGSSDNYDWEGYFFRYIDPSLQYLAFKDYYRSINTSDVFNIFIDIYRRSSFNLHCFENDILEYIFQFKPTYNDEFITVYRGESIDSPKSYDSYDFTSWSTDISQAIFFATRFSFDSVLYKTEINVKDALCDCRNHSEHELILLNNTVQEKIIIAQCNNTIVNSTLESVSSDYKKYLLYFTVYDELFTEFSSHDIDHSKRVLLNSLIILDNLALSSDEKNNLIDIVATAAVFHDIGRINDCVDDSHGFQSAELLPDIYSNNEYVKLLIQYHCLPDDIGFESINNCETVDSDLAIMALKVLKDADAVDRMRFKDLNIKYIRLDVTRQLLLILDTLRLYLKL